MLDLESLSNGLKIYSYRLSHTHSVSLSFFIKAGSRYENREKNGITHLLEHMHFRRLGDFSQKALYFKMESIGGTLKAKTLKDMFYFTIKVRPNYIKEAFNIFYNIITAYNWTEEEFKKEVEVVLDQITERDSIEDIQQYTDETVWNNHPLSYPIMGTKESIAKLTLSDLKQFKEICFNPNRMFFVITGCINDQALKEFTEKLEKINFNNNSGELVSPNILVHPRTPNVLFVQRPWDYIDINITFDIDYKTATYEQIVLLNSILGEGVGSKLQLCIREEKGFSSNIYSYVEYYEDIAVLNISFSANKENITKILISIFQELSDLKEKIEEEDLKTTLPFYTDNLWFWLDDPQELSFQIANDLLISKERTFCIKEKINRVKQTSAIKVCKAARNIFRQQNLSLVIMGDCKGIKKTSIRNIFVNL